MAITEHDVHTAFEVGIVLKGFYAVLECIAGAGLVLFGASGITAFVVRVTQHELAEDPRDLIANRLDSRLAQS